MQQAAAALRDEIGSLDVLINNAGITGRPTSVTDSTADDLLAVHAVNLFSPVGVTQTLVRLLEVSPAPTIVTVSSGRGPLAAATDPGRLESTFTLLAYPSSKTALNMVTTQYAKARRGFA